jgi:hypothetical protein
MVSDESKLYHEYLIRLYDELSTKLIHYTKENEMKYTGVIRKSLRQFLESELQKEIKKNDMMDENRNK